MTAAVLEREPFAAPVEVPEASGPCKASRAGVACPAPGDVTVTVTCGPCGNRLVDLCGTHTFVVWHSSAVCEGCGTPVTLAVGS